MPEDDPPMRITRIDLRPAIALADTDRARPTDERLLHLAEVAHRECFIANSLRTEVVVAPTFAWAGDPASRRRRRRAGALTSGDERAGRRHRPAAPPRGRHPGGGAHRLRRSWANGFAVDAVDAAGYRVRRRSDGQVLPVALPFADVRRERKNSMWWY